MNESTLTDIGSLFLALSDNTRLKLISLMAEGEVSVGFLAESIGESQPKVSRHLAYLRTEGLVATRREGKHVFYGIAWPDGDIASNVMAAVLGSGSSQKLERPTAAEVRRVYEEPARQNTFDETYTSDYVPQEIEIYLL